MKNKKINTALKAMELLNNAVGYLQTTEEFTAAAEQILAKARIKVAQARLRLKERGQL